MLCESFSSLPKRDCAISDSFHEIPAHHASDLFFDIASDFMDPQISHNGGGIGADPKTDRTVNIAAPGIVHSQSREVAAVNEDGDDLFGDRGSYFDPLAGLAIWQIELRHVVRVPARVS